MATDENKPIRQEKMPPAETGNASNPPPRNTQDDGAADQQILNEKAEKYLREVSSIEDEPDAQDQQEMDEILRKNNKK